ncbi:DNA cytosine methyltransferase [Brucella rhizosphaerae]|uniref:DNA cytosine methyltransferase n=1 Tax=Brucella rhizosphaerae TaxID=571254 RepID=UPI00360F725E
MQSPDGPKWPNSGMVAGPRARAAWRILDAQYFGLAQRRKRVVVIADFGNGADPAAVLFERKSLSGNTPPSRETGKDIAPTISARPTGGGGLGTDFDLDGGLISSTGSVAHCLNAGGMGRQDYETETMIAFAQNTRDEVRIVNGDGLIAGALAYEPGMNQQTYLAFDCKASGRSGFGVGEISPTLRAMNSVDGNQNAGGQVAVCAPVAWSSMPQNSGKDYKALQVDVAQPLMAGGPVGGNQGGDYIQQQWAVRRLTPTECERLQGFPDEYTNIPWRNKPNSPDGPRYKALGNSWAVPKFRWIGERIARLMPMSPANDNHCTEPERLCA